MTGFDANTWDNGVPDEETRAIVGHGVTVELDGADHVAEELVVHGDLLVPEESSDPTQVEDGRMKLYVNGGAVGDAPASQLWKHNGRIGIGGIKGATRLHTGFHRAGNYFDGLIDKVATHNRALTGSEIEALYAASRDQTAGVPQDDIASLWMFTEGDAAGDDEAEGGSVADTGAFKRGATATGDTLNLDGDGDYFRVRSSSDLNRGVFPQKTISLWFKVDNTDGTQMIYEQGGGGRGLNIYLDGDTLYAGGWNLPRRESHWTGDWITKSGIVAGEWNHVALTLDATAGSNVDKSLSTRWVHVNSGGNFQVGSEDDRYDEGTFTLNLLGTDKDANHVIETNMMGMNPGTMDVNANDGFPHDWHGWPGSVLWPGQIELHEVVCLGGSGGHDNCCRECH